MIPYFRPSQKKFYFYWISETREFSRDHTEKLPVYLIRHPCCHSSSNNWRSFFNNFCNIAFSYRCDRIDYSSVEPFTSLPVLTVNGTVSAVDEKPYESNFDREWLKSIALKWLGRLMEKFGEAIINQKGFKSVAALSLAGKRCEKNFSVIFKAVSQIKGLLIPPGNRSKRELPLLILPESSSYEPTLTYCLESNPKQNSNALCGLSWLLYLTRALVQFNAKL